MLALRNMDSTPMTEPPEQSKLQGAYSVILIIMS